MKILYYSCHEVLEYDEIRMFRELGHQVFSLGTGFTTDSALRPLIDQSDMGAERALFESEGCTRGPRYWDYQLTSRFVEAFDVSIVMSDAPFIVKQWDALRVRPVVWRTVGMGVDIHEWILESHRNDGLKIVRYSPTEERHSAYLGSDALIRFLKEPQTDWRGEQRCVLTFSNMFERRYPKEIEFFRKSVGNLPFIIGGASNEGLDGAIGVVSFEEQARLLRDCRAYFYCHGTHIPYTLNFIEAWAAGIPVVALHPGSGFASRDASYSEIPELITHGETGFVVSDIGEAHAILCRLLDDVEYSRRIGLAGKTAAQAVFGPQIVASSWNEFLLSVSN